MGLGFIFESIETEAARKRESLVSASLGLEEGFFNLCSRSLPAPDVSNLRRTLAFAKGLTGTTAEHPSIGLYMNHPLRIATFAMRMMPSPAADILHVALLHNVFEVASLVEGDLTARGYPAELGATIRLLTIDRSRENDRAYLTKFYGNIESHSQGLSLVRCLDKLDNLLGCEILPEDAFKASYIGLAEEFVAPMAERLQPEFGAYFRAVCEHMRRAPFSPELKKRHEEAAKP